MLRYQKRDSPPLDGGAYIFGSTQLAKHSEGINFPSTNNVDPELPGKFSAKSSRTTFGDLLIHLRVMRILLRRVSVRVPEALGAWPHWLNTRLEGITEISPGGKPDETLVIIRSPFQVNCYPYSSMWEPASRSNVVSLFLPDPLDAHGGLPLIKYRQLERLRSTAVRLCLISYIPIELCLSLLFLNYQRVLPSLSKETF